jgi:hypothetical protein
MKKLIGLSLAAAVLIPSCAQAQTICQRIGTTMFCDNGLSSQTIGNTTFYSNGVIRQDIGNQSFYSSNGAGLPYPSMGDANGLNAGKCPGYPVLCR